MNERMSSVSLHKALNADWNPLPGWRSMSAVNHTTVGRRFIVASLVFFLIGGILAMLIRTQLATADNAFMDSDTYSQVFTMHGTLMMFLFAIPMLEGFAFYLLPKMLGARDMAYPCLGAFAWWCYLFGGVILIGAMIAGVAPDSGWFMYTPLSGSTYAPGINSDIWLIGITFAEISAICAAIELITTILKFRAPGMALHRMPIFAWYMLVTAGMILVGFPPLILASILLELERAFGLPFFEVSLGGDPLLWQHLFWIFGHPEVYIIFLPAAGMVSTMVPVFAGRPLVGYIWIVVAIVAMGFVSFGLWVHHMYTVGIPQMSLGFFSAASMLVALPTTIQFFAWIATLWSGTIRFRLPMFYLAGFFVIFMLGGLTGVMVALVPFNWQVHDTHFIVAHLHYVLVGGMVFPVLAAACFWLPHLTGRMPSARIGTCAFWLIFIGFKLAFLPMHLTGLVGMPRRIFSYGPEAGWDVLNLLSSAGGFIQAVGFALFILDIFLHKRLGPPAERNPWNADTMEWAMPTPTPSYNFASLPEVHSRHPLWDNPSLGVEQAAGRHWLARPAPGYRQTLSVDVISGQPQSVVLLPGSTWLPLYAGLATGAFFICFLFKLYGIAIVAAVLALLFFLRWAWQGGARDDPEPVEAAPGVYLETHLSAPGAPGWWGMACSLVGNAAIYASLLFGYFFLITMAPKRPESLALDLPMSWAWVVILMTLLAFTAVQAACFANQRHRPGIRDASLLASAAASMVAAWTWFSMLSVLPDAGSHAYVAVTLVLICYAGAHCTVSAIIAAHVAARGRAGYVSAHRGLEPSVTRLWVLYTMVIAITAVVTLYLVAGVWA